MLLIFWFSEWCSEDIQWRGRTEGDGDTNQRSAAREERSPEECKHKQSRKVRKLTGKLIVKLCFENKIVQE